ncbi:MAG: hypothetical protein IJH94_07475, partial [Clostridia bacterium]|nr:hypothetical protein [Clostridia bacterium]
GTTVLAADMSWSIARFGNLYIINGYKDKRSVMYHYNIDTQTFRKAGNVMDKLIVTAGKDSTGNYLATIQFRYTYVDDYTVTDRDGNVIKNSDFFDKYFNYGDTAPSANIFQNYFKVGDEVSVSGFPSRADNVGQVWFYSTTNEEVVPQNTHDYDVDNTVDLDAYASVDEVSRWQVCDAVVKGFNSVQRTVQRQTTYIHYIYFDLYDKNGDAIDFIETEGASGEYYVSGVTLSSRQRCFENIASHNGRLWGAPPSGNVIYASSSDDIFSFSAADITAGYAARLTDSAPGRFTALAEYGGELAAFKPENISVIYGTGIRNYNIYTINGVGCIDGESVCATPYGVIYLGESGFYCWAGGMPSSISEKLKTKYISAVGAFAGDIYYAAAVREDGERELLTCDLRRGLWHVQDDVRADGLFAFRGLMHMVSDGGIFELTETAEDSCEWYFTTAVTTDGTFDNKALNELWIRADVTDGAEFSVETASGRGAFTMHSTFTATGLHVFRCPVRAVMRDSYRIRISGRGRVVVYDMEIRTAPGGRMYMER